MAAPVLAKNLQSSCHGVQSTNKFLNLSSSETFNSVDNACFDHLLELDFHILYEFPFGHPKRSSSRVAWWFGKDWVIIPFMGLLVWTRTDVAELHIDQMIVCGTAQSLRTRPTLRHCTSSDPSTDPPNQLIRHQLNRRNAPVPKAEVRLLRHGKTEIPYLPMMFIGRGHPRKDHVNTARSDLPVAHTRSQTIALRGIGTLSSNSLSPDHSNIRTMQFQTNL